MSKNRLTIPTYPPLTTGRELNTKANCAPLCPFGKAQDEKKGEVEGDGLGASTVEKKLSLNPKIPRHKRQKSTEKHKYKKPWTVDNPLTSAVFIAEARDSTLWTVLWTGGR